VSRVTGLTKPEAARVLFHLRRALAYAKLGHTSRVATRIRAALKSAEGAYRHACLEPQRRLRRQRRLDHKQSTRWYPPVLRRDDT